MRALLGLILLSIASISFASDRFYGELHAGVGGIRHSDLTFRPIDAYVSFGGYFVDHLGIDVSLGGPLRVGEDSDFDAQLENLGTVSLRFDSPPLDELSAFILIGISQFSVSQRGVNPLGRARTVRENFQGGTLSIGLRQKILGTPLSMVGIYRLHYVDQPIDFDSWSIGLRAAWK